MYQVWNIKEDKSHGEFDTLSDARGCVLYDHLTHWEIWQGHMDATCDEFVPDVRVARCDPYEGDDDRIKLMLGQPCRSETIR